MKDSNVIPYLRVKFAERTWNDTFQHVRRCMEKSRDASTPCEPLLRSLERLQDEFNVPSLETTMSRLETITKQQGLAFHVTGPTCYLTADLFYLEVSLRPCGGAEEVKVAPHGGSPVSSESLLQLLRLKNYADFSRKLAGLFAQYNIPGENEIKLKLLKSLQFLGKDLEQISHLPRPSNDCNSQTDVINNGRVGCLIVGKEDYPLTIQFYVAPTETTAQTSNAAPVVQEAQVTVGASDVGHRLQMSSVMLQPPQLDPQGSPAFLPPGEVQSETLAACFLLKLQPPVPMTVGFVKKLSLVTDVAVPDVDLQWAPLPRLLTGGSPSANSPRDTSEEKDSVFTLALPGGVTHTYVLPGAAWQTASQSASLMRSVPFARPTHVPSLLELLRHQCVMNGLLSSCCCCSDARGTTAGPVDGQHFEVLPESDTSFSVTFCHPHTDSLAVLLVNVPDSRHITCRLFGAETSDAILDQYVAAVMMKCLSIPLTLRALHTQLKALPPPPPPPPPPLPPAALPLSQHVATEAENHLSASSDASVTDTNSSTVQLAPAAAVPDVPAAAAAVLPASACFTVSVANPDLLLPPEITAAPAAAQPYTFSPVSALSQWMGNSGQQLSEPT